MVSRAVLVPVALECDLTQHPFRRLLGAEYTPLTARYNMALSRIARLTAVATVLVPASLVAQSRPGSGSNRMPDKDAAQVMITSFKSSEHAPRGTAPEKVLGYQAAEEMRKRVDGAFPSKQLFVIPVERLNLNLEASNFSTTDGLDLHDAKALASISRADEFIAGTVAKTASGFKVDADLVLTRDINARQPLGVVEAPKLSDAIDGTKVAKDLVAIDPRSNTALNYIMEAYDKAGPSMSDSLVLTLLKMMQNDPKNSDLVFGAIQRIASATNPGIARPIIDSAIVQNPGDPDLLKLRWQILYAMKDYTEMFAQGKELIRFDTAFADTTYFVRTANAYVLDSAWKDAAATLEEGTAKFPTNAFLVGFEVQMLQKAGEPQKALDKLRKASAAKVAVPDGGTIEIQIMRSMNAPSGQIVARAKELITAGDTTTNVRQSLLNELQTQMKVGTDLVKTNAAAAVDSLNVVLGGLKDSESIARPGQQKAQVAFLSGMINTTLASVKAQQAAAAKSCQLARDARANATAAMTYLPQGAEFAPAATVQTALGNAIQIDGYAEQLMKSIPNCK